ncbi:hypothetical protein H0H81_011961 [Sphagnurus paluster]|uniref:Protein kinase domain-containing protein n=1 Tax=Sphagnurus paluster TaxID=117069 RepID=A0A9P7GNF4_9AGAR|nr:hypothetical protein H0H81_011961 [Sphagnurus paluster]
MVRIASPLDPAKARQVDLHVFEEELTKSINQFVNCAVGKEVSPPACGLTATTTEIASFIVDHPKDFRNKFILVDTPGLGTGAREDHKIMKQLAEWLKKSFPAKVPRKIALLYLVEIDSNLYPHSEVYMFPKHLISQGVSKNSIILTTKLEKLFDIQPGHERRALITQEYSSEIPVYPFENSSESAWKILDSIDESAVDLTQFRRKLAKVVSTPRFGQFWTRFGVGSSKPSRHGKEVAEVFDTEENSLFHEVDASEVGREVNPAVIARLQELSSTLGPALLDKDNYRKLLACRGPEAQALLDTFQSILRADIEKGASRRNLIYATKRLSTNSQLYPSAFMLGDVDRLDEKPIPSGAFGAFADICRGTFQKQPVCLKILRIIQGTSYDKVTKMIAQEGILWGQLSHPNLLPLWGLFRMERHLSLVSPWVENGNLVDYIQEHPTADRCADIADGIDYMHENEIVHGDLKGVNILVSDSGRACLADFGLSSINDPEILYWATQSAAAGGTGGTVRWQAPELFAAENDDSFDEEKTPPNTKAVDIYAWSCICLEIFTGTVPFAHIKQDTKVLLEVANGASPPLPEDSEPYISLGLSPIMRQLMSNCWERDPSQRPDAKAILHRLDAVKPPDARPSGGWKLGPAMYRSNLSDADVPLTLERLEEILSRDPPPS